MGTQHSRVALPIATYSYYSRIRACTQDQLGHGAQLRIGVQEYTPFHNEELQ